MLPVLLPGPADLTYLTSWKDMGTARVTCTSGCECNPKDITAQVPMAVTSVFFNSLIAVCCCNPQSVAVLAALANATAVRCRHLPSPFRVGFATPQVPGASHHTGHNENGSKGRPAFHDLGCDATLRRSMSFILLSAREILCSRGDPLGTGAWA